MESDKTQACCRHLKKMGYGLLPPSQNLIDLESDFKDIWQIAREFTMTSEERGYSLYKAVEYVVKNQINGAFVECGVWRGGSCMVMALALQKFGGQKRPIYLYDTFSGMTDPGDQDIISWNNRKVADKQAEERARGVDSFADWAVGKQEVKKNLQKTGYPADLLYFVSGPVEQTLTNTVPETIAILRLDTDWYASTKKELEILYPLLASRGVLIIDDYGHFKGARQAVDEYFGQNPPLPLLSRVDYTGRQAVKP